MSRWFTALLPTASSHICFAEPWMSSCTREDGSRMWVLWLAGWLWCVCGKVPLVGSLRTAMLDKGGPSISFPPLPDLSASLPWLLSFTLSVSLSPLFPSELKAAGTRSPSSTKASRHLCEEAQQWYSDCTQSHEYGGQIETTSGIHSILHTYSNYTGWLPDPHLRDNTFTSSL